jgi:hypothetical protein
MAQLFLAVASQNFYMPSGLSAMYVRARFGKRLRSRVLGVNGSGSAPAATIHHFKLISEEMTAREAS